MHRMGRSFYSLFQSFREYLCGPYVQRVKGDADLDQEPKGKVGGAMRRCDGVCLGLEAWDVALRKPLTAEMRMISRS